MDGEMDFENGQVGGMDGMNVGIQFPSTLTHGHFSLRAFPITDVPHHRYSAILLSDNKNGILNGIPFGVDKWVCVNVMCQRRSENNTQVTFSAVRCKPCVDF